VPGGTVTLGSNRHIWPNRFSARAGNGPDQVQSLPLFVSLQLREEANTARLLSPRNWHHRITSRADPLDGQPRSRPSPGIAHDPTPSRLGESRQEVSVISLEVTNAGVLIPVKAQPGARRNAITGTHDGSLKVVVSQAPEKAKANIAIIKILAESLDLKKSQIELHSGPTSSHKKFLLIDVTVDELHRKLAKVTNQPGQAE
jgi:uncharacterized protein (TIGR00251 family)